MRAIPWSAQISGDESFVIQPDGCRDIILETSRNGASRLRVTELDCGPRRRKLTAGTTLWAVRLRPGTTMSPDLLQARPQSMRALAQLAESETQAEPEIMEIIETLSQPGATLAQVAARAGVSPRSLQRQFRAHGLKTPEFWRLLGRARRMVQGLGTGAGLSEIAHDTGFADQSHMTRESHRWFGLSPAALQRNPALRADICRPGLGTWP